MTSFISKLLELRDSGIDNGSMLDYHTEVGKIHRSVYWTEPNLTFLRVRFISSRGEPMWDLSYAHGVIGKDTDSPELVNVDLPNWQIEKWDRRTKKWLTPRTVLIEWAKADHVYLKDKGFFDALSFQGS